MRLLEASPQRIGDYQNWLGDARSYLESKIGADDPETLQLTARLVRRAKELAYRRGWYATASLLPERPTKSPLDGCLRLREATDSLSRSTQEEPPALLTIRQVAGMLSMDERSVRRRVSDGTIPPPLKLGRLSRWRRLDIEALCNQ